LAFLSVIPGYAAADFRVGKFPVYSSLIAGVHAGSALNTIFHLKVYVSILIHRIAIGRTNVCGTLVRAGGVTDLRIHHDMRFDVRFGLISVTDKPEAFGQSKDLHDDAGLMIP
jgi:hypothetical protein